MQASVLSSLAAGVLTDRPLRLVWQHRYALDFLAAVRLLRRTRLRDGA
jgi:hypothetical protein